MQYTRGQKVVQKKRKRSGLVLVTVSDVEFTTLETTSLLRGVIQLYPLS